MEKCVRLFYKQNIMWKTSCILLSILEGWWWETGRQEGSFGVSSFFVFLLSWKNCCIASAHSVAKTPLLIFIFGWNGWTGAGGTSLGSDDAFSPPSGKSLQKKFQQGAVSNIWRTVLSRTFHVQSFQEKFQKRTQFQFEFLEK